MKTGVEYSTFRREMDMTKTTRTAFDYESYKDTNDLVRAAQLYYHQHLPQQDIAKLLDLTQTKVSRLIQKAQDEGYITINFNFPQLYEIASELCFRFELKNAVVAPSMEPSSLKEGIGQAAARYFENEIKDGDRVGISCGNTLYYMVRALRDRAKKGLVVSPLASDTSYELVDIFPSTLVGLITAKLRPDVTGFSRPLANIGGQLQRPGRRGRLRHKQSPESGTSQLDIMFSGVGEISANTPGFSAMAKQELGSTYKAFIDRLRGAGAIAEFNYQLVARDGQELSANKQIAGDPDFRRVSKRLEAVSLSEIRRAISEERKTVVCVAGGPRKVAGIRGVLQGRIANVLITDFDTAIKLLA